MKIVMLISSFYPLMGGAERQAQRLSVELINLGHEVTVLTRKPFKDLDNVENINGINVIRLNVFRNGKLAPIIYLCKTLFYLYKNRKNIDVVHAHSLSADGFIAALASFLLGIPSVSKIAGGGNEIGCEAKRMYLSGGLKKLRILFMNKFLSKYIAISSAIKKDLENINVPKDKVIFIPNGILIKSESLEEKEEIRRRLSLPTNKKLYLYAGRFELVKGIDILLKSWQDTSKEFKMNSQLIILGQGSIDLANQISDKSVSIIGKVDNVEEYMLASDFFVLPSRYEGISNALLEAIVNRLPVICSDAGGNTDIVDENTGFLFTKENSRELTNLLEMTSNFSFDDRKKIIDTAFIKIKNQYDLSKVSKEYDKLYNQLISK